MKENFTIKKSYNFYQGSTFCDFAFLRKVLLCTFSMGFNAFFFHIFNIILVSLCFEQMFHPDLGKL